MKRGRHHTRMDARAKVHGAAIRVRKEVSSCNVLKATPVSGPVLVCWQTFGPNDDGDRDVESSSSTSNDDV